MRPCQGRRREGGRERQNGVLYLNPGSAGPRRFTLPVTLARLLVHRDSLQAELVELKV